jgi:ferredoxin
MLYVDPDTCVDCGACVPVCPVQAIYFEHDLPADKAHWLEVNRTRSGSLPVVDERGTPLPGADVQRVALGFSS